MAQKFRSMATGVVVGLCVLAGVAGAQGQSQGRGRGNDKPTTSTSVTVVFRDSDHATFRDYFLAHKITAEPLPPGIAKNVARGKPLPPGIAKRAVPADLVALGPKLDKDTSLAIVGDVVIATKGGLVIDIMAGVFKR
jgi:hypothetical protein